MMPPLTLHDAQELSMPTNEFLVIDGDTMTADLWVEHEDGSLSLLTVGIAL